MKSFSRVSTGIKGLDKVLGHLQTGDNVVLQVDSIEDYRSFVTPFVREALDNNERVVYMRFARHAPLLEETRKVAVYKLNPDTGFESFSTQVHNIIRQEGRDVFYVFDSLSDLLLAWATDLMIGNFFVITCPYLFELNTVAYFAILRGRHSFKTVARIRETTQVLLDVYNFEGKTCVHPLKVLAAILTHHVPAPHPGGRDVRPDHEQRRRHPALRRSLRPEYRRRGEAPRLLGPHLSQGARGCRG